MAQINIRDETRDRINILLITMQKNEALTITQDFVITKALDLLEVDKNV